MACDEAIRYIDTVPGVFVSAAEGEERLWRRGRERCDGWSQQARVHGWAGPKRKR